ncbi:alpha/beta hydrolase [Phycisphaera mikurensis]|uniref:Phospholipase/carboxylesterase family protein n=1 Tax=Phycisphaera mikurensis (strain NBRC 102666 / KCTC 22515 / FYK2301M01) TaxID=1142394 RepID=I0II52_PHYMF|nr:dienelactone hydrolase family protein [Phycisphaera mikurensis]MBB6442497.1 putative esterase [Phycisphaera mikurensis]BAM04940.1 phospholipase/carboxylesterase family protein [Phycisphaera mikurensis NBRC 102666]
MSSNGPRDPHATAPLGSAGTPLGDASGVVLLLHGRGGSAADILSLAPHLDPGGRGKLAFRAPQASGNTWYPGSFLLPRDRNQPHLSSALSLVHRTIDKLTAAVPAARVFVVGFSQGACLAAESVFRRAEREPLGGVVGFTGGLIGERVEVPEAPAALDGVPVLLTGGDPDPHVPWARVEETAAAYRGRGASVEIRRFPGKLHGVSEEEVRLAAELIAGAASG